MVVFRTHRLQVLLQAPSPLPEGDVQKGQEGAELALLTGPRWTSKTSQVLIMQVWHITSST